MLAYQELSDEQKNKLKQKCSLELPQNRCNVYRKMCNMLPIPIHDVGSICTFKMSTKMSIPSEMTSKNNFSSSLSSLMSENYQNINGFYLTKTYSNADDINKQNDVFAGRETTVYMTLYSDLVSHRSSGTQATALINKCFQVYSTCNTFEMTSSNCSTCTSSTLPLQEPNQRDKIRYSEIYFFGRKKDSDKKGMGGKESKTKLCKTCKSPTAACKSTDTKVRVKDQCTSSAQTKRKMGATASTATAKSVTIRDDKCEKPCPAVAASKGEMMATISHIKIAPKEPCPVHGKEPCQGPRCIIASSGENQAPVKVTTVTNARRGVFELVIRKITGAPLAKNELLLEWTPPPSRPPPCGTPCPIPCTFPGPCRPSKCKLIICKPSPCRPKCCKKKPCGQPCRPPPCKKCCKTSCCGKPCSSCTPFPPPPCRKPCSPPCCKSPCRSSPCLKPCPVGRKRPRKAKSQPKIKSHKKRTSPCNNRIKSCPVVKCRSVPGCCAIPLPCPPRKCCSVAPCKPPRCCKSSCSTCCP